MAVHELEKGAWQACRHVRSSGCGIYGERPASCRNFSCQWLRGVLELEGTVDLSLRPDGCGVILDFQPGTAHGDIYVAWELQPGASTRSPAAEVIAGLAEGFPVMIVAPGPDDSGEPSARRFVGADPTRHG